MTIFLDTGYLIALEAADDQHHVAALRHWRECVQSRPQLVTTSFVLDEVATFFNSRGRHAKAVEIGERLLASPSVQLIHVNEDLFRAAWSYFRQRADKRFSLTDQSGYRRRSSTSAGPSSPSLDRTGRSRAPAGRTTCLPSMTPRRLAPAC